MDVVAVVPSWAGSDLNNGVGIFHGGEMCEEGCAGEDYGRFFNADERG